MYFFIRPKIPRAFSKPSLYNHLQETISTQYNKADNTTKQGTVMSFIREGEGIEKHTLSKAHRRTERGMISPPKFSFFNNSSPGREKILTLISVHMPTAAIEL